MLLCRPAGWPRTGLGVGHTLGRTGTPPQEELQGHVGLRPRCLWCFLGDVPSSGTPTTCAFDLNPLPSSEVAFLPTASSSGVRLSSTVDSLPEALPPPLLPREREGCCPVLGSASRL